jgi:tetratricopeptide (TPR) repeat protein
MSAWEDSYFDAMKCGEVSSRASESKGNMEEARDFVASGLVAEAIEKYKKSISDAEQAIEDAEYYGGYSDDDDDDVCNEYNKIYCSMKEVYVASKSELAKLYAEQGRYSEALEILNSRPCPFYCNEVELFAELKETIISKERLSQTP